MRNRTREVLKRLGVKLERIANALNVPVWQLYLTDEEIEEVVEHHSLQQIMHSNTAVCPYCGNAVHVELTR